jgi:hypothetical protein
MWFVIILLVLAVLFVIWIGHTNLYRHWRTGNDPAQRFKPRGDPNSGGNIGAPWGGNDGGFG